MSKVHYIDNQKFLEEMVKYRNSVKLAKEEGRTKPRIPEYVGSCFIMIAERLSRRPNFMSYTFRDEMISDAIENAVLYVDNFDPEKSSNPFAYYTQIVYYAFLRRIQREKKQLYVKYKCAELAGATDEFEQLEGEDGITRQFELYDNISEYIETFENARKLKKKPKMGLEKFVDEDILPEDLLEGE
jgi:hypothetical protein